MEIVKLAALYPEMEEATIGRWTTKEGETVEFGDPVAEFITDKVAFEYTMETAGRIAKILIADKSVVPVGVNLLVLGEDAELNDDLLNSLKKENEELLRQREEQISGFFAATGLDKTSDSFENAENVKKQVRATPAARRLAKELNIRLEDVIGSGNNGIITEDDVRGQR